MAEYNFIKIEKKLSKYLDEARFSHTLGVMYTCASLAMVHGYDLQAAQIAGLLHDSAKCIPNKKKLKICAQNDIPVTNFEREHPFLLHAKLGAYIAAEKYGVTDKEVLSAITYHTTAKPEMTLLEKIVYIADYIEPARDKAPHLAEILKDTLLYLDKNPDDIDNTTKDAFDYYNDLHNSRFPETNATEHPNKES